MDQFRKLEIAPPIVESLTADEFSLARFHLVCNRQGLLFGHNQGQRIKRVTSWYVDNIRTTEKD